MKTTLKDNHPDSPHIDTTDEHLSEEMQITIRGQAIQVIKSLCSITGKKEPVDVIIAALRVYEWILAQQTKGATVVAELPNYHPKPLANYIKNPEEASSFFEGREIFNFIASGHTDPEPS